MFHPRVSFASCIKIGSLTYNKRTLLLYTFFLSSILSPPNASATSGQILLRQVEAAVGTELNFAGGVLVAASRTDSTWRQGLPLGGTWIWGMRQGPPHQQEWHRHLLLCLGLLLSPAIPHRPLWLQPSSPPLPLSLNPPGFH